MFFVGMNNVVIRNTVFAEKLPERFMAVLGVFGIIMRNISFKTPAARRVLHQKYLPIFSSYGLKVDD